MNYLTVFLFGIVLGLALNGCLSYYLHRNGEPIKKAPMTNLATKEDIEMLTKEIEEIKNSLDSSKAEEEFYNSISNN